jgi:hypothetical protein
VGAHSDLLAEFPYLGPPHSARRLVEAPISRGVDLAVDVCRNQL